MSRIAVVGSGGMLGHAVHEYMLRRGHSVLPMSRREYDITTDPIARLDELLDGVDVVVNCAGLIKATIAEHPIETALLVNSVFPHNLARLCVHRGIRCFHIATDAVFSGARGQYMESDYIDCTDLYGLSKAGGDSAPCMVLRTSIVGEERAGQSRSLLEWARCNAGKSIDGFTNHVWNGVSTIHLAEVIDQILATARYESGVYHIYSPKSVTKMNLLAMINDVYDLGMTLHPIESAQPCNRSLASNSTLARDLCRKPIRQQLEEMRDFFLLP